MWRWCLLVLVVGCGRLQFESHGARDATTTGSADAARSDAAADGVLATTCGTFTSHECDGFEGSTLDPKWTSDSANGSITIDTTRAYRGSSSVHVHINATTGSTNPRATLYGIAGLQPAITGRIYFRVWIWIASPLTTTLFNQIINASNTAGQGMSMGTKNGVVANNNYTDTTYAESATALPLDRWTCLQYEMPSNTTGAIRMFVDGTELTDATLTKSTAQPAPSHVYIGIEWVGSPNGFPAADAWLDELVIDTSPTTCAQ